jgi:hypothetical protein
MIAKGLKDQFSRTLRDWREWQSEARSLWRAALILHQEAQRDWDNRKRNRVAIAEGTFDFPPKLEGAMTMLNGLAIENLVKALWVQKTTEPVEEKGCLRKKLKTHKIIPLLEEVGFTLSTEDKELLLRLESYVTWAGKYPMPEFYGQLEPQALPNRTTMQPGWVSFIIDGKRVCEFIKRIEQALI